MRIGVPTTSYPRFDGDVAGVFVRELSRALVARGHSCEVIAPDDEEAQPLADPGIDVVRARHRPRGWPRTFYGAGAPDNLAEDRAALLGAVTYPLALARLARERSDRWDAVLSHWGLPCAAAAFLARGAQRHVAVWHSADVHLARRAGPGAWRWLRATAETHVFVAEHLRARVGARDDPRAQVIPMGVSVPRRAVAHEGLEGRPLRALVLARLVPIKRVALAIEACALAGSVELVVAGDGPERDALHRLAAARGVRVRFVGTVGEEGKRALLAWADVLLATSGGARGGVTEGYPVAPREALAHGVVVVATEDPAHRELAERCGRAVVLVRDDELAPGLRALAADPTRVRALSASACTAVLDDDWSIVAARIEALLDPDARARRAGRRDAPPARARTDRAAPGS